VEGVRVKVRSASQYMAVVKVEAKSGKVYLYDYPRLVFNLGVKVRPQSDFWALVEQGGNEHILVIPHRALGGRRQIYLQGDAIERGHWTLNYDRRWDRLLKAVLARRTK